MELIVQTHRKADGGILDHVHLHPMVMEKLEDFTDVILDNE